MNTLIQRSARAGRPAGQAGPGLDIKSRSRAGPGLICNGPGRRIRPVQITVITVCLQLHNNASINRSSARDPSMLLMLFTRVHQRVTELVRVVPCLAVPVSFVFL